MKNAVVPSHVTEADITDPLLRSHLIAVEKIKQVPHLQMSSSQLYNRRKSSSKGLEELIRDMSYY